MSPFLQGCSIINYQHGSHDIEVESFITLHSDVSSQVSPVFFLLLLFVATIFFTDSLQKPLHFQLNATKSEMIKVVVRLVIHFTLIWFRPGQNFNVMFQSFSSYLIRAGTVPICLTHFPFPPFILSQFCPRISNQGDWFERQMLVLCVFCVCRQQDNMKLVLLPGRWSHYQQSFHVSHNFLYPSSSLLLTSDTFLS